MEEILKKNHEINQQFIQSLIDDFATLFVAGTDTTSHAAQMAIYHIFKDPTIRDQLKAEVKRNI